MGAYLNALFSRVYNSTGAIRDPCVGTVKTMVSNVASAKMVKEVLLRFLENILVSFVKL